MVNPSDILSKLGRQTKQENVKTRARSSSRPGRTPGQDSEAAATHGDLPRGETLLALPVTPIIRSFPQPGPMGKGVKRRSFSPPRQETSPAHARRSLSDYLVYARRTGFGPGGAPHHPTGRLHLRLAYPANERPVSPHRRFPR